MICKLRATRAIFRASCNRESYRLNRSVVDADALVALCRLIENKSRILFKIVSYSMHGRKGNRKEKKHCGEHTKPVEVVRCASASSDSTRYEIGFGLFDHITPHLERLTNIINRTQDIISWIFSPFPSSESIFICIQVHAHCTPDGCTRLLHTLFLPRIDCDCNCKLLWGCR